LHSITLKVHFLFCHLKFGLTKRLLPSGSPIKPPTIIFTIRATWPTHLDYSNNVCRRVTTTKLSIMSFSLFFVTFPVLVPNAFPSTPNLEHPRPMCLRQYHIPIYTPIQTRHKFPEHQRATSVAVQSIFLFFKSQNMKNVWTQQFDRRQNFMRVL
jgi:hypothetical protein